MTRKTGTLKLNFDAVGRARSRTHDCTATCGCKKPAVTDEERVAMARDEEREHRYVYSNPGELILLGE